MSLPTFLQRCLERPRCIIIGLLLRLALLVFGHIQDSYSVVKYTDIDYSVYSDAAAFMVEGQSPYERATYRYTPLLAGILMPVVWLPLFGKLIFVAIDLVLSEHARRILLLRGMSSERATRYGMLPILFNPLVINLSTRGNADILIVALVVGMILALIKGQVKTAAIVYGLAVHVKIYPIIYAPAIILFLNQDYPCSGHSKLEKPLQQKSSASSGTTSTRSSSSLLKDLFHPFSLKFQFFLWSAGTFFVLTGLCYLVYGYEFLFETYLYHVTRVDTRHNFSVYFYQLYLESSAKIIQGDIGNVAFTLADRLLPLMSFMPQLLTLLAFAFTLYQDLPLCIFAQTLVFVAFNKVMTAQYFLWWLIPLILIAPQSKLTWKHAIALGGVWMGTELNWLRTGYNVEFLGLPSFYDMWIAGLFFFLANCFLLACVLLAHRFKPVFIQGVCTHIDDQPTTAAETKRTL